MCIHIYNTFIYLSIYLSAYLFIYMFSFFHFYILCRILGIYLYLFYPKKYFEGSLTMGERILEWKVFLMFDLFTSIN